MISKKEVKHIADLARIELSADEEQKFEKDLSGVLDFVAKLNEIDTSGVLPLAGGLAKNAPEALEGETREDEAVPPPGNPAELVNAAPKKEDGWIEVKAVFQE